MLFFSFRMYPAHSREGYGKIVFNLFSFSQIGILSEFRHFLQCLENVAVRGDRNVMFHLPTLLKSGGRRGAVAHAHACDRKRDCCGFDFHLDGN